MAGSEIVRTGLITLAAALLSSAAGAQTDDSRADVDSPGLMIEAIAGWDGTVDRATPIPVSFLIRNDSDQIIEGYLRLSDPGNGHEVLLGEIVMAPGTVRRFNSIQALTDWFECFATLAAGEQILWRRELALVTEFRPNVNYALFIDDGGRKLQLPGEVSITEAAASQALPGGERGRPVQTLTVKTWQVPNHPGPLVAAQAIILPEGAKHDDLNQVQWRAIAEWLCQGGALFVHSQSPEILERLTDSAPLDVERPAASGQFKVRRVGLGSIYEYPQPLFASEDAEIRQLISDRVAKLPKHHISTLLDSAQLYNREAGRADLNRLLVVAFFGCYAFFSGAVALLLFRATQRRIGAYTVVVVAAACVLSALLGGYLRFSRGDLRWLTLTQAGAGGLVQVGRIEVQSAGGRNTRVAINGVHPDLQFIGGEQRYFSWHRSPTGYPPFTWQPNQAPRADDTYQVSVTMTPWGRRRLHATAFQRDVQSLDVQLKFEPRDPPAGDQSRKAESAAMRPGVFSLRIVNRLPFDLRDCWLVIGATRAWNQADQPPPTPYGMFPGSPQPVASPPGALIDVYHRRPLHTLAAGATREESFDAEFQVLRNDWDQMLQLPGGALSPPRVEGSRAASAWIVALVETSPIVRIDEQRSEFIPQEQLHFYVQEILPENLPPPSLFPGAEPLKATDAAKPATR